MAKRLYALNVRQEYPNLGSVKECKNLGGKALLQANYGEDYDCTLTCLAFLFGEQNYSLIEKIATKYGYNGKVSGTNPLTVKAVMKQTMQSAKIKGTPKSAYLKNVGFSWKTIKELINGNHYVILNLSNDGRGYYKNHSVTIIGYGEYKGANLLLVYDNWHTTVSYVDYDRMCSICSINYYI